MKILSSSLNTMLIVDEHCSNVCCDAFLCHELIAKVNKQNNSELKKSICNQHWERLGKLKAIKNAILYVITLYLLFAY